MRINRNYGLNVDGIYSHMSESKTAPEYISGFCCRFRVTLVARLVSQFVQIFSVDPIKYHWGSLPRLRKTRMSLRGDWYQRKNEIRGIQNECARSSLDLRMHRYCEIRC